MFVRKDAEQLVYVHAYNDNSCWHSCIINWNHWTTYDLCELYELMLLYGQCSGCFLESTQISGVNKKLKKKEILHINMLA